MEKHNPLFTTAFCAVIITLLFHRQLFGLNVLLAESLVLVLLYFYNRIDLRNINHVIFGSGLLLTSLGAVFTNSVFVIIMNLVALFIFTGVVLYPETKSIINAVRLSFFNLYAAQADFFKQISTSGSGSRNTRRIRKAGIFVLPLLIISFFIWIYRNSNPIFDRMALSISSFVGTKLYMMFGRLDTAVIFTFLLALLVANFLFLGVRSARIISDDQQSTDNLVREKKRFPGRFKFTGLLNEFKAGIFLLIVLNAALLIMNAIDVYFVWFNFSWNGQYLKQFVHEGTYLLLLSILCSIAIVLYFFRGNLNFYSKNKVFRYLSYIWLLQNAVLTLSVAMRNFWYIKYFALAYRRIGLIIFLILTIYGLYTVFVKVRKRKSSFYLFRTNILAVYVLLIISSLVNWDNVIARYNFAHTDKSFIDLEYNSTLSDKALPYLDKTQAELHVIQGQQQLNFHFEEQFMEPAAYHGIIEKRKVDFINRWESESWLSWNLPEYKAYQELKR